MWLLLRELELGVLGALLGRTAWMLCPFNLSEAGGPRVASDPVIVGCGDVAVRKVLEPEFDHHSRVIFEQENLPLTLRSRAVP